MRLVRRNGHPTRELATRSPRRFSHCDRQPLAHCPSDDPEPLEDRVDAIWRAEDEGGDDEDDHGTGDDRDENVRRCALHWMLLVVGVHGCCVAASGEWRWEAARVCAPVIHHAEGARRSGSNALHGRGIAACAALLPVSEQGLVRILDRDVGVRFRAAQAKPYPPLAGSGRMHTWWAGVALSSCLGHPPPPCVPLLIARDFSSAVGRAMSDARYDCV